MTYDLELHSKPWKNKKFLIKCATFLIFTHFLIIILHLIKYLEAQDSVCFEDGVVQPEPLKFTEDVVEWENSTLPLSIPLYGFSFCRFLEGSYFYTAPRIDDLSGSLTFKNRKKAVQAIDSRASELRRRFREQVEPTSPMDDDSVARFSCYMTALAKSEWSSYASSVWLHHIDPRFYYPDIAFTPKPRRNKKKYKIAYLIMTYQAVGATRSLYQLLEALNSENAIVLIHTDARSWLLYERMKQFLRKIPKELRERVHLMDTRHPVQWGMSSIVMTQCDGFFQLLDLGDWDYVINLSSNDYPLRSTEYIHKKLKPDHAYLSYFSDQETVHTRVPTPHVLDAKKEGPLRLAPDRDFIFKDVFPFTKHHQWMILPRGYVEYLRTEDWQSHNFLAWAEHGWVPDEFFFGMSILRKDGKYRKKVVNDSKRYIGKFLANALHPKWLSTEDIPEIQRMLHKDKAYFARKIKIYEEKDLIAWMDAERTGKPLLDHRDHL